MILYLIVLLEGFVTISLEILTIRQLIPVVGNSVVVTSLIIGVFLLFLAEGYRKGGTYKNNYTSILQKNFLLAAFGLGIGLSYAFIEIFFEAVKIITPHSTLIPLIVYLLLIIAPVVYVLGQTVPITLNLWKKNPSIGAVGGQILHVSTIGSFLGATITALLLLNYLGVAWSVFIDFGILALLIIFLTDFKVEKIQLLSLMGLGCLVYGLNVSYEKTFFVATNNYGNYRVEQISPVGKFLVINDSPSSYLNYKNKSFAYIEWVKRILFSDLAFKNKNILVLGAGGFTLSAEGMHDNQIDYVDIDQRVNSVVKKHFLADIKGNFIADDARHYLMVTQKKYDAIVSDVCSNRHAIPAHLVTREYFLAVKNKLTDQGVAIFNIIAKPTLENTYLKRIDNTLRTVFNNCMVAPLNFSPQMDANVMYVCRKSIVENDKTLYTDNLNRATVDFFNMG